MAKKQTPPEITEEQVLQTKTRYEEHGKITAIGWLRSETGLGLAVTKNLVEHLADSLKWSLP